jgi:CBS domain-containing protein
MTTTTKPLLSLTAGDVMSGDLILVPRQMSLRAAAHLLSKSRVSGAPVVDDDGHCIGVLSATDFLRCAEKSERAVTACTCQPVYFSAWQIEQQENLPLDRAESYMTADPVMVPPEIPIKRLARMMLDAHIHRVIVVDTLGKPIGLVSSTDILAAVAHADDAE